jgi:multiple sugar transport system permease protein
VTLPRRYLIAALVPALALMVLLVAFPTVYILILSVQDYVLTDPTSGDAFVGGSNYAQLLDDDRFLSAARRSVVFTVISVGASVVVGFFVGKLVVQEIRGASLTRSLLIIPMVTTPLVAGAAFRFMLDYDLGVVNWFLDSIGLDRVGWLSASSLALPTAALVDAWQWMPFVALVMAAGIESLPREPLEAAKVDGAGFWQELRHIVLPMLRPLLAVVILIRTMDAFREFDKIFIMTAGGPGTASETLPVYVWRVAFNAYNMSYAAAVGVTMLIAIILVSALIVSRARAVEGH